MKAVEVSISTPRFSPPTEDPIDGRKLDSYSLGCVYYNMLTGSYLDKPLNRASLFTSQL